MHVICQQCPSGLWMGAGMEWGQQDGLGSCSVSPQPVQKDICAVQWEGQKEIGILSPLVNISKDNV